MWRYEEASRSYQGWHLSADEEGCRSLLTLLSAFTEKSSVPYRTLSLAAPSEALLEMPGKLPWNVRSVSKLRLSQRVSNTDWHLFRADDTVTFEFGERWRVLLFDAIRALSDGD